jgi:TonB family protein
MAITEIPPSRMTGTEPGFEPDSPDTYVEMDAPELLVRVQDDISRSRVREAFWISVVVHLAIVLFLVNSQRIFGYRPIAVMTAADLMQQKDTTFLALPPDEQKLTERPKSNVLSDKDRIASSRNPTLDRKELEKILDAHRAGPRGPQNQPQQPTQAQAPAPAQQQGQQASQAPPQQQPTNQNNQMARLEGLAPQRQATSSPNPFTAALAPGSSTEQAARAAAAARAGGSFGGGDMGMGIRGGGNIKSNLDILTDTQGVDFGPYLARVVESVRMNWYNLIPEAARSPLFKKGVVAIEFAIMKDGRVAGMKLDSPSGDVSLDRAAWGGISASNPFPPLPGEFRGSYLGLRFRFYYNPDRKDLQ